MKHRILIAGFLMAHAWASCSKALDANKDTPAQKDQDRPTAAANPGQQLPKRPDDTIDFTSLSTGLYWFGKQGHLQKANIALNQSYYDPQKPTLIYVHGWQPGQVATKLYESPLRDVLGEQRDLAEPWIDKGWNVGFFLWTQFADDTLLLAEQKIWDSSAMTWINSNGQRTAFEGKLSASDWLYQDYVQAMQYQSQSEIRIAGHSLGSQMASILAKRLTESVKAGRVSRNLLPQRLVLLDPFFTGTFKTYLGDKKNGDVVRANSQKAISDGGMSFEIYRTSSVSFIPGADLNPELNQLSAFRNIYTDGIFTVAQQAEKHVYAVAYYLWSFATEAAPLGSGPISRPLGFPLQCVSASSAKSDLIIYMNSSLQARSTDAMSARPEDDSCTLEPKGTI